jgi:DNA polymerase-3 subunit beta
MGVVINYQRCEGEVKFQVEKASFTDAVTWAARTLPTRPAVQALAGLLIESVGGDLHLSSFDFSTSAKAIVPANIQTPGKVLVNGRILADIVKALPNKPINIEVNNTRVELTCDRSTFALSTISDADYPALPDLPTSGGSIPKDIFTNAVTMVAAAAGIDSTLPMLTGIKLEISGESFTLAATDRYRLAVSEINWKPDDSKMNIEILIPAKFLSDAAQTLTSDEIRLTFSADNSGERLIGIETPNKKMTSRLLDAEFPKYKTLLPTDSSTTVTINTQSLIDSAKRVSLVGEKTVRCEFQDGEVLIKATSGDTQNASEVVECEIEGDGLEIAFNEKYLTDGLRALGTESTQLLFTSSNRPAVLVGVGDKAANYRYLLMPVRTT